jgi:hypothetical protein
MKSSILRSGVALACALGLAACGGGDGDLPLSGSVYGVSKDGTPVQLTKEGLVLQNNGGDDTVVPAPYTSFAFSKNVSTDDEFNITVKSRPSNTEKCEVNNAKARANYYTVQQISVICTVKSHRLVATVNGLTVGGLVLVNGTDRQPVPAGATSVEMASVTEDGAYGVTVLTQPQDLTNPNAPKKQVCTVTNGTGTMGDADSIGKVVVNCVADGT